MDIKDNNDRDNKIRQMFYVGQSVNKIAAKYGISMYCVCQIIGPETISVLEPSVRYIGRNDDCVYLSGINDAYTECHINDVNFNY